MKNSKQSSEKKETFSSLLLKFGYSHDIRTVFDDFLTLTIAAFSQNLETGKSYLEDEYMQVIGKYKKPVETDLFPKLLGTLITEMEHKLNSSEGFDVLGDFFEVHCATDRKAQFFTPWPICQFMAKINGDENFEEEPEKVKKIIDPACGSGRMLMSGSRIFGSQHEYFGIDIDSVCIKMSAVNLLLSGIKNGEVMQANALSPTDFNVSYRISHFPFGIFRITEKEESRLWHLHMLSFKSNFIDFKKEESISLNIVQNIKPEQLKIF